MDQNRDFVFYEGQDSDGYYWTPLVEEVHDMHDFDMEDDDDMDDDMDDMDDIDHDGIDDHMDSDFDGELTDGEHHDLHVKLRDFCDKYGCPEEELHDLCHEYAQTPMDETDDEDYGDEEDSEDEFSDEDYEEDDDLVGPMDESWDEYSMEESVDECMGESVCHSCNSSPCKCDECDGCGCSPCECKMESRKRRPAIRESRKRPSPKSRQPRRK